MPGVVFTVLNKDQILARMKTRAEEIAPALLKVLEREMARTRDHSKEDYFLRTAGKPSPGILHQRSGALARAINSKASLDGKVLMGSIGVSNSEVPYGKVHEQGGIFERQAHERLIGYNSRMQQVKLLNKNGSVRAAVLKHGAMSKHTVRKGYAEYPARPFLRPAMMDRGNEILQNIAIRAREVLGS